ncbi:hypothetical protein [Plantactinospora endophytica]|uniref:Metal-dependent hydrolase n=1 Tax=Plantactinospora endophytica TaxID=673535 RepID=A0ABQ4DXQ4_9ACTN|nr:hypothetical protein [Plantactinospora endophytica]GIG87198.1 hypothetical protein Pen02_21340 [Plantactinospora endophytica]
MTPTTRDSTARNTRPAGTAGTTEPAGSPGTSDPSGTAADNEPSGTAGDSQAAGTAGENEAAGTAPVRAGSSGTHPRRAATRHFLRHLAEMTIAMIAGMLLLGPVWQVLAGALDAVTGLSLVGVLDRPDVAVLVMATDMTVGMTLWMRHRGHRWRPVAEMGAAMYLPFLIFLPPYRLGMVDAEFLMMAGHLLMLPAMLVAMLARRDEYTGWHPTRRQVADPTVAAPASGTSRRLVGLLKRRWPTWLALVVTIDNWGDPLVLDAWVILILPLGYLAIGAVRRQFGDRRMLVLQLAGLAGYLLLVGVAVAAPDDLGRYLVGAGWLAHSVWDYAHHRANRVVPRGFSEWCAVFDAVIGITILLA